VRLYLSNVSPIPHLWKERDPVSETVGSFVFLIIPDDGQSVRTQYSRVNGLTTVGWYTEIHPRNTNRPNEYKTLNDAIKIVCNYTNCLITSKNNGPCLINVSIH
jgi:hypothetical protein